MIFKDFSKYSGCGNDFILCDNRQDDFPCNPEWIRKLCTRKTGVGADGLIFLEESAVADFKMRIFNADGSEAEMCGNGARCFLKYLHEQGFPLSPYKIETKEKIIQGSFEGNDVSIDMGCPTNVRWNLDIDGHQVHFLNTGVPHAVIFVDELASLDLNRLGKQIRRHAAFAPKGTNATFVQVLKPRELLFSTYERGVEAETMACGTGAAAAAYAYSRGDETASPIIMNTKNGDRLTIKIENSQNIFMKGPAEWVYKGKLPIESKIAMV